MGFAERLRTRIKHGKNPKGGHSGSSRVESRLGVWSQIYKPGDVYLGKVYSEDRVATIGVPLPVSHKNEDHVLYMASTRSGKTSGFVMPNLILRDQSFVALDPKGELSIMMAEALHARGFTVMVLDPLKQVEAIIGRPIGFETAYNPLAEIDPYDERAPARIRAMAQCLIAEDNKQGAGGDQYWEDLTRIVVAGLAAYSKRLFTDDGVEILRNREVGSLTHDELVTVTSLQNLLLTSQFSAMSYEDQDDIIRRMETYDGADQLVDTINKAGATARQLFNKDGDPGGYRSLMTMLTKNFAWVDSIGVRQSLAGFDRRLFMPDVKRKEKVAVFAVLPIDNMVSHGPWLAMIMTQLIKAFSVTPGQPPATVDLFADEIAQVGRLEALLPAFTVAAGQGLRVHAIVQSLAQLHRIYGEYDTLTLLANSSAALLSTSDPLTTETFSKKSGMTYAKDPKTGKKSKDSKDKVPVWTADEIERLGDDRRGVGLYFRRGMPGGVRFMKTPYHEMFEAGVHYIEHPDRAEDGQYHVPGLDHLDDKEQDMLEAPPPVHLLEDKRDAPQPQCNAVVSAPTRRRGVIIGRSGKSSRRLPVT